MLEYARLQFAADRSAFTHHGAKTERSKLWRGERSTESARARHAKRFTVETLIPLSDILRAASLDYDAN